MRSAFGITRLVAAAFGIIALIALLIYNLGFSGPVIANFLSYFTMQSAIWAVVLWIVGGIIALRSSADPPWLVTARMIVTGYQVVSGIVFSLIVLEAAQHDYTMVVPWSNQALHFWLSAYAVLDWTLSPGRGRVSWRQLRLVLWYPLLWIGYTLARGPLVRWYPYFFLDPTQVTTGQSALYCLAAAVLFVGVAAGLIGISRALPHGLAVRSGSAAEDETEEAAEEGREEGVAEGRERAQKGPRNITSAGFEASTGEERA